jgi:hypothetical protein
MIEVERQQLLEKRKNEDIALEAAFIAAVGKAETVSNALARMLGEK